ncbi:MAG: hypothetical protein V3T84_00995 [Phycisphaerales bacterium]
MTTTGPQMPRPTPMTPPTDAGAIPPKPSSWPMVIGVIAIVFGSLATLGGCFGLGSSLFIDQFMSLMPQGEDSELTSAMQGLKPVMIISASLTMVLAIVLLIGGIGVLRCRAWGRSTCLTWAGLKMVLVVCNSVLSYVLQQAQFQAMAEDPNMAGSMPGFLPALMQAMGAVGLVVGLLWGWALPVFMLIWFSRRKIKAEVAQWGHPAEAIG